MYYWFYHNFGMVFEIYFQDKLFMMHFCISYLIFALQACLLYYMLYLIMSFQKNF